MTERITSSELDALRCRVGELLSEKRYRHTLGVERAAVRIATACLPDRLDELRAAALLHDITKEYSREEQLALMREYIPNLSDDDYRTDAAYHSLTAPYVIERDFPRFATTDILSAVRNHTLADEDMSLFDEIIFISDFVEDGRTYFACRDLGERLFSSLWAAEARDAAILALHRTTLDCLDFTVRFVLDRGYFLHGRTARARDALLARIKEK